MNQSDLQPVLTWCHEHAAEARNRLSKWNERFAADPCEAVRNGSMIMFHAVAEIEVYEGLIELLSKPRHRITLHDLRSQAANRVLRDAQDAGRTVPVAPTTEIYLQLVSAIWTQLHFILDAAHPTQRKAQP